MIAHVGGRYADLRVGHDGRFERAVEVHSCWGTFEWLLHDAFDLGHRVGVVCHSDDHKGRPGAAWPGAGQFGAIGGLTCYLMPKLDRETLFGPCAGATTTAPPARASFSMSRPACPTVPCCSRTIPRSGPPRARPAARAMMGDVVQADGEVILEVDAAGSAPLERIVVLNGKEQVATHRGYAGEPARPAHPRAVRGRGISRPRPRGFLGGPRAPGRQPLRARPGRSTCSTPTSRCGWRPTAPAWMSTRSPPAISAASISGSPTPMAGEIDIVTEVVTTRIPIAEIGLEDVVVDAGGLGRRLRLFRLPDQNATWQMRFAQPVRLRAGRQPALCPPHPGGRPPGLVEPDLRDRRVGNGSSPTDRSTARSR